MQQLTFYRDGKTYKRIQKRTAERLYNEGKEIIMCPCKYNLCSCWAFTRKAKKLGYEPPEVTFQYIINEITYYNCGYNEEVGRYLAYYVEEN